MSTHGQLRRRAAAAMVMFLTASSLAAAAALRSASMGPDERWRLQWMVFGGIIALLMLGVAAFDAYLHLDAEIEQDRAGKRSDGQHEVLERIAAGAPLDELLGHVCRFTESCCPDVHVMIHLLEEDGLMLRTAAAPSVDKTFADAMDEVVVGPRAASFGSAVYGHQPVFVSDIKRDTKWDGYRALALEQGYLSSFAFPISSQQGRIVGALSMYSRRSRNVEHHEIRAAETATQLAGIAIGRAHAQESLRQSEASFRSFVENSPVGIYRVTRNGRLLAVNSTLVKLLGYGSVEELLHVDMAKDIYVSVTDRERLFRELEARGDVFSSEALWRRKDGTTVQVRISARAHRDERGLVWFSEGFVEDVTPLRAAEQALRQSEKLAALGQLVSGVAHELNNPLSAILHFAEELLTDDRSPADREALSVMRDQARRSRAIVRDLLSFVRGRETARERVLLTEVLAGTTRALRPEVDALGATLVTEFDGLDVYAEADRSGLEQVITNLVINAAQAAGVGGTVTFRGLVTDSTLKLMIEDSGPGIPPEIINRIFEPFFTTKPTGQGTGLGLSVTLGIVQQLGGRITVENRTPQEGGGARFIVLVPAVAWMAREAALPPLDDMPRAQPHAALPQSQVASDPTPVESGPKPRVLLIDDELSIRIALRRFFSRRGWDVSEAADGDTALTMMMEADPPFAAVISDLKMPGFSGVDLHDTLARERPELLERVIFSTGDVASRDAAAFVRRTQCTVLRKPFELRVLDGMLERLRETQPV